jgi:hypothetical protein
MPRRHPPLAALAVTGAALLAACLPGARPPVAPERSSLSLDAVPGSRPAAAVAGPLAVVFAGPRGETKQATEIAIVFNKPMRALGLAPGEPAPPVSIAPPAKGAFHWLGSSALRFDAAMPLAPATAYRVSIPAGTRALDGSTLDAPFVLAFTTPRPAIVDLRPSAGATDVGPAETITLEFNQPVGDAEILRAVSLHAGKQAAPLAFTIVRRDEARVELAPTKPLPLAEEIHVHADASLRGEGGDLPAGKALDFAFSTARPPSIKDIHCAPHPDDPSACNPDDPDLTVVLSAAVPARALGRALVIDPPVAWDRAPADQDSTTWDLTIRPEFKPGTTYRVRVDPARGGRTLADEFGQRLTAGERTLRFGERPAQVRFGLRGTYWSPRVRHDFPVSLTNVSGVELRAAPRPLDEVLGALTGAPVTPLAGGKVITLPEPRLDQAASAPFDLDALLPAGTYGPIALQASYRRRGGQGELTREVQLTELGITARAAHGGAAVLLTRIDDARPAAGAEIAVHRIPKLGSGAPASLLGRAVTDASGLGAVPIAGPFAPGDRLAVVARSGADWTYRLMNAPGPIEVVGMAYAERGIYRPGETVKLGGVVRVPDASGLTTPREGPVSIEVRTLGGALHAEATLTAFGTFTADIAIPRDARLGLYFPTVKVAGGEVRGGRFMVSDYRPTEIEVEATTARPEYVRGDTLGCGGSGRYLYGGAMAGSTASIVVGRSTHSGFRVPGLDGFTIDSEDGGNPPRELTRGKVKLDARGKLLFEAALTMPGQGRTEEVTCDVEVMDRNRQALSSHASAVVHPAEIYVALANPSAYAVAPGATLAVKALAVTPAGERRSVPVHIDVVLSSGGPATEAPIGSCDVTTGGAPVSCSFTVPRGITGNSTTAVVRARAVDRRGNPVRAGYSLGIETPPKPSPPPPPPPPGPSPRYMSVSTGRSYAPGDTGEIAITSPWSGPATALITIEREGILWRRVMPIAGTTATVPFPVTPEMIPNAEVHVTLLSGREAKHERAWFDVKPEPRRLQVTLDTGGEAHAPGEELDAEVRVVDAAGKPARAEVTLWAADEGSLSLTYYNTPDPLSGVLRERSGRGTGTESRDDLVIVGLLGHQSRPPQVRMGATQVSGEARGDFRQTAFYEARLVTDATGRVRRRVKLPDGLTTYRVMAVAIGEDDRSGSGKAKITTSLPLMARATLPRVIRAGDRFEASVVVSTRDLPAGDVEVRATAEGVTLASPAQRLHVDPGHAAEIRFPVRADRAGTARLTFRADLGAVHDAMTLTREVVTPLVPESASIDGETKGAVAERLGELGGIRPDHGGLSITLSPTPLAGLAAGIEQLVEYPYGCTEQTVSRLVPLLPLRDLAAALGARLPADAGAAVEEAVKRVLRNQRRDGGFGLWPESRESEPWISAYALWGLVEARRRGISVPEAALSQARAYLAKAIAPGANDPPEKLAMAAFVADLEAGESTADAALASRLYDARDRLPPFAQALLLHAMAIGKQDPSRRRELARALEGLVRLDGPAARVVTADPIHAALLDSDARTTAMLLRALVASDPESPLIPRLTLGLLAGRRAGRFRTTHEAAWALLALDAVRRLQPAPAGDRGARVFLGDAPLLDRTFEGAKPVSLEVSMPSLLAGGGKPLTFESVGAGALHYEARLRFARRELPAAPVESGFFVRRAARSLEPAAAGSPSGTFAPGDLVAVEIEVVTPSPRDFVVLESPLPGGFEPANVDIRGGGEWLRKLEESSASRRELRDDRVVYFVDHLPAGITRYRYVARATTPGTFVTPPARVEEMYAPETFGRTAAETIVVAPRP